MNGAGPRNTADVFRAEAEDLFEQLEHALLDLESRPGDADLVATVFRALHTIKGSASIFGLDALSAFTHQVESIFHRVRSGEVAAGPALIAITLAAKDHMRALLAGDAPAAAGEAILADLARAVAGGGPAGARGEQPRRTWRIRFTLPADAFAIGTDPEALIAELMAFGEGKIVADTSGLPRLADLDPNRCYLAWEVILVTDRPVSAIEDVFLFIRDGIELTIEPVAAPPVQPASLPAVIPKPAEAAVRVAASRIESLMDQVGELTIAEGRLLQLCQARDDPELLQAAEEIERLSAGLRDIAMSIRMVPIGSLFARFRRPVHDLAGELGKRVQWVTEGEETELDKTMVESLHDPLLHLVRNAVDHGIEDVEARVAAGKPAEGRVGLAARHVGAEVLVTVSDDGRGLDHQRIRAKAVSLGLLSPDADPGDGDLFDLIFRPGFSTAARISNVSGRGVGLDVVKTAIESLRGRIEVVTEPGRGTSVILRLPLTLAIIDGLLIRVGGQPYVIPLSMVEECIVLPEDAADADNRFLSLRDELVPFLRLREVFDVPGRAPAPEMVVVVAAAEGRVGLVVDQLLGGHQTVVKALSRLHRDVRCISGATILGDGGIALILDVLSLIVQRQRQEESARQYRSADHVD